MRLVVWVRGAVVGEVDSRLNLKEEEGWRGQEEERERKGKGGKGGEEEGKSQLELTFSSFLRPDPSTKVSSLFPFAPKA